MKKIKVPLMLVMLVFIGSVAYHILYLENPRTIFTTSSPYTLSALIISLTFFILRFIDLIIWSPARERGVVKTPRLFIELINIFLLVIIFVFLIDKVFHKPINSILAASGVLGVIIGLSMQRIIADIFTGVAVNMDKTIQIHDKVEVINEEGISIMGQVVEINWRTIKLRTIDNNLVVIPNGVLATKTIKNLSVPSEETMQTVDITLDFEIPVDRVLTLLEAAILSVESVLESPKPEVVIDSVSERGVVFQLRFWININKSDIYISKHHVYYNALKHIYQSGLSLSYLKHDIYYKKMPQRQLDRHRDLKPLLKRVPLFKMLNAREIEIIHKGVKEIVVKKEQSVVTEGFAGSSMFIVVEGVLSVYLKKRKVNQLIPGDFFGEMSLLTGEPRSATIIARTDSILYEIKKNTIMRVLKERPEVGKTLSKILAERVLSNKSTQVKYKNNNGQLARTLFTRMKEFFFG